jgi:hypothetical protein
MKKLREGILAAGNKTSDFTKLGRIEIDVLGLKKETEEKLLELGGRVFHLVNKEGKTDIGDNKEIIHLIAQLKELEEELSAYKAAKQKLKHEGQKVSQHKTAE